MNWASGYSVGDDSIRGKDGVAGKQAPGWWLTPISAEAGRARGCFTLTVHMALKQSRVDEIQDDPIMVSVVREMNDMMSFRTSIKL
jgi:hypothetical protein